MNNIKDLYKLNIDILRKICRLHNISWYFDNQSKKMSVKQLLNKLQENEHLLNFEKINNLILDSKLNWIKKYKRTDLIKICKNLNFSGNLQRENLNLLLDRIYNFMKQKNITSDEELKKYYNKENISVSNNYISLSKSNKIKYIIHLSDLHIRYNRINEYYHVFNNLLNLLKTNPELTKTNTVIIVCGDIFHEKKRQQASALKVWNYFVKEITSLFPLFVITGNHDYDMLSNDIDWLESSFETDNYYHLNTTGEYQYGNIIFGISALKDYKIHNFTIKEQDKIYVQLYHGSLNSSIYDNGQCVESIIKISDFGNFDYLLLGDIHKHQYLKDNVAYSGSLIQQNRGEHLFNHGYILWNLENKTSDFIKVNNDYCFLKCFIKNNILSYDENILTTKKFLNISFFIENTNIENENKLILEFKQLLESKNINIIESKIIHLENEILDNKQVENISSFNKSLDEYIYDFLNKKNISNEQKEQVYEIYQNIQKNCPHFEQKLKHLWKIDNIKFQNIFCYGQDINNEIDFDKNGIYKVLGDNFIGKTSIINIIKWGLFGGITAKKNLDCFKIRDADILNKNSENGFIECNISFYNSHNKIKIIRNITKDNKLKDKVRIQHILESNFFDTLIGYENVKNKLNNLIGNYKEFELISSINNTDKGILNTENKNNLSVFLGGIDFDKFEIWENECKTLIKNNQMDIKLLEKEKEQYNINSEYQTLLNERKIIIEKNNILKLETIDYEKDINELNKQINNLNIYKFLDCVDYTNEILKLKEKLNNLSKEKIKNEIKDLNKKNDKIILYKIDKNLNDLSGNIKKLEQEIENINENEIKKLINNFTIKTKKILVEYKTVIVNDEKIYIDRIFEINKNIENLRCKNDDFTKKINKNSRNLESYRNKLITCCETKINIKNEIDNLKKNTGNITYEELTELIKKQTFDFQKRKNQLIKKIDSKSLFNENDFQDLKIILSSEDYNLQYKKLSSIKKLNYDYEEILNTERLIRDKIYSLEIEIRNSNIEIKKNDEELKTLGNTLININNEFEKNKENIQIKLKNDELIRQSKIYENVIKENEIILSKYYTIKNEINFLKDKQEKFIEQEKIKIDNLNNSIIKKELEKEKKVLEEQLKDFQDLEFYYEKQEKYIEYLKYKDENEKNIEIKNKLQQEIEKLQNLLIKQNEYNKEIIFNKTHLEFELKNIDKKINEFENSITKSNEIKNKKNILEKNLENLKIFLEMINYNGIPLIIINEKIPLIEKYINNLLNEYTNFNIKINISGSGYKKNIELLQYKKDSNRELSITSCSGYEVLILNIIIKLVLKKICFVNICDLLMIDEVLASVSIQNYNLLEQIFGILIKNFKCIILITHIENIKEILDNYETHNINICKTPETSFIKK